MADEETPEVPIEERLRVAELRAAAFESALGDRANFFRQAGMSFGGKRDFYNIFGYTRTLTTTEYRERYARGGIAGRIVDAYPKATWRGGCEVVEDENPETDTTFEQAWKQLEDRLKIISILQDVDTLSALSSYAVLLIGSAVDGNLSEPLPKAQSPDQLIYLTPYLGGGGPSQRQAGVVSADTDATIKEFETDTKSPRFGQPKSYQLRRLDVSSPELQKPVHWTRIIHIAEGGLDNKVYGTPRLERCWNLLDDLDKVTGGGAEAFFLRANQGMHLDIDKKMPVTDAVASVEALKVQMEEYKHQLSRVLRTRGVNVSTLGSDVADFSSPADAVLTQISGCMAMPKRILTGSEMGQLASGQDRDNWDTQVMDRRTGYAGPSILTRLIDRLIEFGYLPKPAKPYTIEWPEINNLTEGEKAEGAKLWAESIDAEGLPVFTNDEIRDHWYGMDPIPDDVLEEMRDRLAPEPPIAVPGMPGAPGVPGAKPKPRVVPKAAQINAVVDRLEAALASGQPVELTVRR